MTVRKVLSRILVLVTVLFLSSAVNPAAAEVIYRFSLPANGEVGSLDFNLTSASFLPADTTVHVLELTDPPFTSFTFGTPYVSGVIAYRGLPDAILFGIALFLDNTGTVPALLTRHDPADFFVFNRTETQTGTFYSTGGTVESSFTLATSTPLAELEVSSNTPEPAAGALLALGLAVIAGVRRRPAAPLQLRGVRRR